MKYILIVIAALSAFVFTGCEDDTTSNSSTTSHSDTDWTEDQVVVEEPEATNEYGLNQSEVEELYASKLRADLPEWFGVIDTPTIIRNGEEMCKFFAEGTTYDEMVGFITDAGYPADIAPTYIGYTVGALCPVQEDVLE